jgi:hypothetical protein
MTWKARPSEWRALEPALVALLIEEGWPEEAFVPVPADCRNIDFDVLRAHGFAVIEDNGVITLEPSEAVQRIMEERNPPTYEPSGYTEVPNP